MEHQARFEVKPPSGVSPRAEDTPRTRNLKELRKKRLMFFETRNQGSSSTTDSSGQESNLNNVRDVNRNLNFEDVRASMAGDSRVVAVEASRSLSRPSSAINRDASSRDSLQQSSNFLRNALTSHQDALEDNGNLRGQGHVLGTNGHNVRTRPGTSGGVHSSWNGTGRPGLNNSTVNQRPLSASTSLGFTLPTLSPKDSNIITPRNDNIPPVKTPQSKKKPMTQGKPAKGKAVKGKKTTNSMSASRESFENATSQSASQEDSLWLAGRAVGNNEPDNLAVRKSVIDAEFEDDYSELGLSVDRQGFDRLQGGGYHIPAFNPSHKPKSRSNSVEFHAGMRASQSNENFAGLGVTAIPEELHRRPEVADSYEFAMRKSATHDGLFNAAASGNDVGSSKDSTISDPETARREMQENIESVTSSFVTDSVELRQAEEKYRQINDVRNVPKPLFGANPVHADSMDFEKTRAQASVDNQRGVEVGKRSVIKEELASNTLQTILGRERMERLLKNLEESAWLEDENSTLVGVSRALRGDISLESVCSGSEVGGSVTAPFAAKSSDLTDLGLTTHRPPEEAQHTHSLDKVGTSSSVAVSESGGSTVRKSTKCSYSSNEIYARARKLSNNSANEEQIHPPSSTEQLQAKNNSQEVTKSSTLSDFLDSRTQQDTDQESANRFDYIRGIQSVKKEFYKTVTVTDSTAVSDTSTTKLSKQSVDSPRGQIHRPPPQTHVRSISGSEGRSRPGANNMKEEHIEGIRQHVADIRTQQFEDKIKAGMPYTTSSIERYFASMEKLNFEAAKCFEPIPEPNILETPREDANDLTISGSKMKNKSQSEKPSNIVKESERNLMSHSGSKSISGMNGGHINSLEESKENNIDKALSSRMNTTGDEKSLTQREKWDQFKVDNDKKKLLKELLDSDQSDDDDLFTKVTSIVEDEKMTCRLKSMGIDFDFLKQKPNEGTRKKSSVSNDMDILSMHSSEFSHRVEGEPRKNNNVGAKSSKNLKPPEPEIAVVKANVDDEVEMLFEMSPRNKKEKHPSGEQQKLGPTPSGEPTVSKTSAAHLIKNDSFDMSDTQESVSSSTAQVKVCPECAEVNKTYVTWCTECGGVLSGIDPVPYKGKRDTSRQLGLSSSTNLSKSATNFKNRLEESMYNPSHASLSNAWHQQSQGRSDQEKSNLSPEKQHESLAASGNKEVLSLRLEGGVRDSDDFEYEKVESPVRNLPKALQSELSLDLKSRPESGSVVEPRENDLAHLSEAMQFEYKEVESPKKLLSAALQEELNLNLSLDGSQNTTSFRGAAAAAGMGPTAGPSGAKPVNQNGTRHQAGLRREEDVVIEEEGCMDNAVQVDAPPRHGVNGALFDDENDDVPIDLDDDGDEEEDEERIVYNQFVKRLMNDPRLKSNNSRPQSAMQPTRSAGRPRSAIAGGRARPQSAKPAATSKVRASIESDGYKRKWGRSSTTAWSAMSHGEVRARSSLRASIEADVRPSSAVLRGKSTSGVWKPPSNPGPGGEGIPKKSSGTPEVSTAKGTRKRGSEGQSTNAAGRTGSASTSQSVVRTSASSSKALKSNLMNTYAKYFEMSPRIAAGEFSQWLCLPDEIWLHICGYLGQRDLGRVAQTCMQLHRVALDESLWKTIVVKKNHKMIDEWLAEMGRRLPSSLSLVQCHGEGVSANGLRELFRQCSDSLKELNFTGCSRGELTGDNILLHAASRCRNITHFDASWSNVNDHGVIALIEASKRLESVCLNGCQVVTDEAVHALVAKHGKSLKTLELFGCFNITPRTATYIAASCKALTILNLGQCWKLTDVSISRLAPTLTGVINLDLRGCKQMKDTTIHQLMNHCKKLQSLSVANCPNLTDVTLTEIATYCSGIQSLDLCGCKGITDMGVRALAMACHSLEYLDVSSSAITHKSVSTLASYCHAKLEVLKLNFCKHINVPSLVRLAKNCKQIRKLYLYGVNGIRNIDDVRRVNSNLWIEL